MANLTQTFHDETHEHIHAEDTEKKLTEMAREAYLMRREIAIIASVFFLALIGIVLFAIGSMTQVNLPV
jgi:lipopolysaccharide/colanic/teichoic acid biosynthesis glycosyltransferase